MTNCMTFNFAGRWKQPHFQEWNHVGRQHQWSDHQKMWGEGAVPVPVPQTGKSETDLLSPQRERHGVGERLRQVHLRVWVLPWQPVQERDLRQVVPSGVSAQEQDVHADKGHHYTQQHRAVRGVLQRCTIWQPKLHANLPHHWQRVCMSAPSSDDRGRNKVNTEKFIYSPWRWLPPVTCAVWMLDFPFRATEAACVSMFYSLGVTRTRLLNAIPPPPRDTSGSAWRPSSSSVCMTRWGRHRHFHYARPHHLYSKVTAHYKSSVNTPNTFYL